MLLKEMQRIDLIKVMVKENALESINKEIKTDYEVMVERIGELEDMLDHYMNNPKQVKCMDDPGRRNR